MPKGPVPWLLTASDVEQLRAEIGKREDIAIAAHRGAEAETWEEAAKILHTILRDSFQRRCDAKLARMRKGFDKRRKQILHPR